MELGLAGSAAPASLKIEYLPRDQEPKVSGEYRNSPQNDKFSFEWSPDTCRGLRFIVGLAGGQTREFKWEGEWAVARALASAKRTGSKYVWSRKDDALGTYEVHLKITGPVRLVQTLVKTGGENPIVEVIRKVPQKIVRVKK